MQSSYQTARVNLERQKERSKDYQDRKVNTPLFTIGQKVLLHDEKIRRGTLGKLSPPFIGTYDIIDIAYVNIAFKIPRNRTIKFHANRLKLDYHRIITLLMPASALDATLQIFKESPAFYYDHIREAHLYNTEWRMLDYMSLQEADQDLETVRSMLNYLWILFKNMNALLD